MTEEIQSPDAENIFATLSVPKILIATIQTLGEITIPTEAFINAGTEDQELQVDYNSDNQTFTFKLKVKDESGTDNNELITDFE